MDELNIIQQLTIWALPVLFAITFHEAAHGWIALRCGDQTAYLQGRLSLNPLNHIDLVGTVIVPAILLMAGGILFGWAKPVPVNWGRLKHPKRDMALVALAGPLANVLMALFWAALVKLTSLLPLNGSASAALTLMGIAGININLLLAVFNLIPLPPLDGSRIVSSILPARLAWQYNKIEPYGFFILLLLILVGAVKYIVMPGMTLMIEMIAAIFNLPLR